jgi:molecular chaperone HtpG
LEVIKSGLTKRVLEMLGRLAQDAPEKYQTFWKEFGVVLKEGVGEDASERDKILPLLRFASTHETGNEPTVSLAQYVARMKSGQERIYFLIAESIEAARASPYIEQLKARGIEVLLLSDRIDEWIMGQIEGFEGKRFKDAARGDLELGALASEADKHDASCLVLGEHDLRTTMRRLLAAAGQKAPDAKPILELNVAHPIVKYLDGEQESARFAQLAELLYDQASLAEGGQLANPADYVQRLNRLLIRLAGVHEAASA